MFKRKGTIKGHDRYAVYRLVGRSVAFANPRRRTSTVRGKVRDVCRDIFAETVKVELEDGRAYEFKEPDAMLRADGDVVLVYGDASAEPGDEETFRKAAEKGFEADLGEVLRRTAARRRRDVRIYVLPEEPGRGRRR